MRIAYRTWQAQSIRKIRVCLCIYIKWQECSVWWFWLVSVWLHFNELLVYDWNVELSTVHTCMLQILCRTGSPRQPFGAWHRRNCCATPPSQEREHVDHSDHDDQPMFLTRFWLEIWIEIEKFCSRSSSSSSSYL